MSASPPRTVEADSTLSHICPFADCGLAFRKIGKLNRHLQIHQPTKSFACKHPGCTRTYTRNDHLRRHAETHAPKTIACPHAGCTSVFPSQSKLNRHLKLHEGTQADAKGTKCSHCDIYFRSRTKLREHSTRIHGDTFAFVCNFVVRSESSDGIREVPCGQNFATKAELAKHHRLCHEIGRFVCPHVECNFHTDAALRFRRFADLNRHLKQSHRQLEWPCFDCSQVFRSRRRLHEHVRIHRSVSSVAMIECSYPGCEHKYSKPSNLALHMRVAHLGLRPYACTQCHQEFAHKHVLTRHLRVVHGKGGKKSDGDGTSEWSSGDDDVSDDSEEYSDAEEPAVLKLNRKYDDSHASQTIRIANLKSALTGIDRSFDVGVVAQSENVLSEPKHEGSTTEQSSDEAEFQKALSQANRRRADNSDPFDEPNSKRPKSF